MDLTGKKVERRMGKGCNLDMLWSWYHTLVLYLISLSLSIIVRNQTVHSK
jgi:hypothetical protein